MNECCFCFSANMIHITTSTAEILKETKLYVLEKRGEMEVTRVGLRTACVSGRQCKLCTALNNLYLALSETQFICS